VTTPALFEPAGSGSWVATDLSRGPWDPRACHGGPVSALLGRAVESAPHGEGMDVARITVELQRPVPADAPLTVSSAVARPGRKVQLVDATIATADGIVVASARALRIRRDVAPVPEHANAPDEVPAGPAGIPRVRSSWAENGTAFHRDGAEHRFVHGGFDVPGPVVVWIRLLAPLVAGEEPTPLQRVLAAADFGNGVSSAVPFEDWTFINPELTVHLARPLVGEWVGMRTTTHYGGLGAGVALSALYDAAGRIGQGAQALLIEAR
jgi:hypothetical protein